MKNMFLCFCLSITCFIFPGCCKETIYRNLYEGIRTQDELKSQSIESRQERSPKSYDQYKIERQERLKDESGE
jgi:hypothetical protein